MQTLKIFGTIDNLILVFIPLINKSIYKLNILVSHMLGKFMKVLKMQYQGLLVKVYLKKYKDIYRTRQ